VSEGAKPSRFNCGHRVELVLFSNNILSVIAVVEFSENNPKNLCYDCWAKESGRPYSKERLERREAERLKESETDG
jgi:hypothetical protein